VSSWTRVAIWHAAPIATGATSSTTVAPGANQAQGSHQPRVVRGRAQAEFRRDGEPLDGALAADERP
jgi:hypothetical protein